MECDVRIALLEDLKASGRATLLIQGTGKIIDVLGDQIADQGLWLIDLSGSEVQWNQTVVTPDGWYLAHIVRHSRPAWVAKAPDPLSIVVRADQDTMRATIRIPDDGVVTAAAGRIYFLLNAFIACVSPGHFFFDLTTQLIAFDELKRRHGDALTPVWVTEHPWTFKWPMMEWLYEGLFGRPTDMLKSNGPIRLRLPTAYTTSRPVNLRFGGICLEAVAYSRQRIFETFGVPDPKDRPKRLYVSRKDAGYREAKNIDLVETMLEAAGFHTTLIEYMTPKDAYDLFYGAEVIIGMHGSGLMYHWYTHQPATVIELAAENIDWKVIMGCAVACGHRAVKIDETDGILDIDHLDRVLKELA